MRNFTEAPTSVFFNQKHTNMPKSILSGLLNEFKRVLNWVFYNSEDVKI